MLNRADRFEGKGLTWIFIALILALMSVAVIYFGQSVNYEGSSATISQQKPSRPARTYSVFYSGGVFSPTNLRIRVGDTVKFVNNTLLPIGVATDPHPEHNNLLGFESSDDISSEELFSYTFSNLGIFPYHNEKNPNEIGSVIVR